MRKRFSALSQQVRKDPTRSARVDGHKARLLRMMSLAELRQAREYTQVQLAKALDTTQSGVSRIEHQTDLYLSTLRSYLKAMGGDLELIATFSDHRVVIGELDDIEDAASSQDDLENDPLPGIGKVTKGGVVTDSSTLSIRTDAEPSASVRRRVKA